MHASKFREQIAFLGVAFCVFATILSGISLADDWAQWRGPNRDGKSAEKGLLKTWPEGGPKMLWSADKLGAGYTQPNIVGKTIYVTGREGTEGFFYALALDGKIKSKAKYAPETWKEYTSTRSIPTIEDGRAYVTNTTGQVFCFNLAEEKLVWSADPMKDFKGEFHEWGFTESPLIVDDKVICTPGGPSAVVALNKETGKLVWRCTDLSDISAYCSPILVTHGGTKLIVTMTGEWAVGIDSATGKLLWKVEHKTRYPINPVTPVYTDGYIIVASGYGYGMQAIKLSDDGKSAQRVWREKAYDTHHGGVIVVDGYIYGSNSRGQWFCVDVKTGKAAWTDRGVGKGCATYADGMLYCYGEKGDVALVKPTPEKYSELGRFKIELGTEQNWAHPVIAGGRLYIRHGDTLMAFDVKAK